jgi:Ni/Co efflux regulator RcnB
MALNCAAAPSEDALVLLIIHLCASAQTLATHQSKFTYIGRDQADTARTEVPEVSNEPVNLMESNMKIRAVASAIMAMSLAVGGVSFAQGGGYDNQNNADRNNQSQRQGQAQRQNQQDQRNNQARQPNRAQNQGRAYNNARPDQRGAGPDHQFYQGQRLPMEYRNRNYVVDDWRGHHLSAPPRGYHWVQTGGDYVLVAIATGIIMQMLLSQ